MDINRLKDTCRILKGNTEPPQIPAPPITMPKPIPKPSDEPETIEIGRIHTENILNFTDIWTDVIEVDDVEAQFKDSDYDSLPVFMDDNHLYNLGFFYVKINPRCSPLEFLGLLVMIPFERLQTLAWRVSRTPP